MVAAIGLGLVFLGSLDVRSPALIFIGSKWSCAITFLAFIVGFALTPLVDCNILAARKVSCVLHSPLLYNQLRPPIPIFVVTFVGAFGILFPFGVSPPVSPRSQLLLSPPALLSGILSSTFRPALRWARRALLLHR
jgi:hypothetical protein